MVQTFKNYVPGIFLALATALVSQVISHSFAAPAMLIALLLGFTLSPVTSNNAVLKPGLTWTATILLQIGVALLGLRISFGDFYNLGIESLLLVSIGIITTMALGIFLAKHFLKSRSMGVLTGGATAICGVSAAMALAAVLPPSREKDRQIVITVVGITVLSSIAMILYPMIAQFIGLGDHDAGLFFGATIHNVPQVVGAGYIYSEGAAEFATLTKLIRISFLLPVVLTVWWMFKSQKRSLKKGKALPKFLIAFFILIGVNEILDIPQEFRDAAGDFSKFALLSVIAAIGLASDLKKTLTLCAKPFCLMLVETLWLAALVLSYILIA